MERIERAAEHSVARGVAFGALAIALVVAGLSSYPAVALKAGAALTLLMWAVLRLKALQAPRRPFRRTEVWLMLERPPDWPDCQMQQLIGRALQRTFDRYARYSLLTAFGFWAASLAVGALRTA